MELGYQFSIVYLANVSLAIGLSIKESSGSYFNILTEDM